MSAFNAQAEQIYIAAAGLPPAQRAEYLDRVCGQDRALREAVERLLAERLSDVAGDSAGDSETLPAKSPPGSRSGSSSRQRSSGSSGTSPTGSTDSRGFGAGTLIAGRYRIVASLGGGGMGEVYRADDLALEQAVALKFLTPEAASDPASLARLVHEVRVAREVTHTNVCRVYDVGQNEGDQFITMEYVDGEDLRTLIRRIGRLSTDKALEIARQLCAGLAAAHDRGVLHRDLKPANIMLDGSGQVRIMDFGLGAVREEVRGEDIRAGTPAYMSPEQLAGYEVSQRSDVYALGLVLYELFTGRPAFKADTVAEYTRQHQSVHPETPSDLVDDIDPAIERIIMRCLAKRPDDRPSSARAVAAALPGSDVLAEAIAAGKTPSPEMIAAAGQRSGLCLSYSVGLVGAFLVCLVLATILAQRDVFSPIQQLDKPPEVLAEHARELFAIGRDVGDEAYGFSYGPHLDAIVEFVGDDASVASNALAVGSRDDLFYWYRHGRQALVPQNVNNVLFRNSRVTPADPPPAAPGMTSVWLRPNGRLVAFERRLESRPAGRAPPVSMDWTPWLVAAGYAPETLDPVSPNVAVRTPADAMAAWRGVDVGLGDVAVRIIAASWRGEPVLFAVLRAESPVDEPIYFDMARRKTLRRTAGVVLFTIVTLIAVPLAYRNLRRKRCDRKGAVRLAYFGGGSLMAMWLLSARVVPSWSDEFGLIMVAVVGAIGEGVIVWLTYIALEPYARRFWPHMLVDWSRVLAGQWRDPLVGRNVLVGALLGTVWVLLASADRHIATWFGLPVRTPMRMPEFTLPLLGARESLALCLDALREGLYTGLLVLMLLVVLRIVLRKRWPAAVVAGVLILPMFMPLGSHPAVSIVTIGLLGVSGGLFVLIRFGPVAVAAAYVVMRTLVVMPLTLDLRAWYADTTFVGLVVVIGIAAYGFMTCRQSTPSTSRLQNAGL